MLAVLRCAVLSFLLVASGIRGQASAWDREQVPLQFATVSKALADKLARDWRRILSEGVERKYCITAWEIGLTEKDHDTIFVDMVLCGPGVTNGFVWSIFRTKPLPTTLVACADDVHDPRPRPDLCVTIWPAWAGPL